MSFEAISVITQAEETAKQDHAQALTDAKAAQAAAEAAGKEAVAEKIDGMNIVKEIYVPGRIINIVVKG